MADKEYELWIAEGCALKAADVGGTSDPYAKVLVEEGGKLKEIHRTRFIQKTLFPVWNDTFKVKATKLVIEVWDHDKLSKDDYLGHVEVDVLEKLGEERKLALQDKKGKIQYDLGSIVILTGNIGDVEKWKKSKAIVEENKRLAQSLHLSPEKLTKLNENFLKLGKRNDGELTREEFGKIVALLFLAEGEDMTEQMKENFGKVKEFTDNLYGLLDTDNSGGVSFREFCLWAALFGNVGKHNPKTVEVIFDIMDTDHSGTLSGQELSNGFSKIMKMLAGFTKDPATKRQVLQLDQQVSALILKEFRSTGPMSKWQFCSVFGKSFDL